MIGMALSNRLTAATILRSGHAKPALLIGAGRSLPAQLPSSSWTPQHRWH
jgi:hypothetical protein